MVAGRAPGRQRRQRAQGPRVRRGLRLVCGSHHGGARAPSIRQSFASSPRPARHHQAIPGPTYGPCYSGPGTTRSVDRGQPWSAGRPVAKKCCRISFAPRSAGHCYGYGSLEELVALLQCFKARRFDTLLRGGVVRLPPSDPYARELLEKIAAAERDLPPEDRMLAPPDPGQALDEDTLLSAYARTGEDGTRSVRCRAPA